MRAYKTLWRLHITVRVNKVSMKVVQSYFEDNHYEDTKIIVKSMQNNGENQTKSCCGYTMQNLGEGHKVIVRVRKYHCAWYIGIITTTNCHCVATQSLWKNTKHCEDTQSHCDYHRVVVKVTVSHFEGTFIILKVTQWLGRSYRVTLKVYNLIMRAYKVILRTWT